MVQIFVPFHLSASDSTTLKQPFCTWLIGVGCGARNGWLWIAAILAILIPVLAFILDWIATITSRAGQPPPEG